MLVLAVALQKVSRGFDDAVLLCPIDRRETIRVLRVAAQAHLDEYQHRPVQHDQIDFTGAAAVVACDRSEAVAQQVEPRGVLCDSPAPKMARTAERAFGELGPQTPRTHVDGRPFLC